LFSRQQFVIRILYYIYYVFRYGAFVFGNNRSFIPKDFGKKSPPLFRKVAVKNAAQVRVFFIKPLPPNTTHLIRPDIRRTGLV
jgi:hypothetical protein